MTEQTTILALQTKMADLEYDILELQEEIRLLKKRNLVIEEQLRKLRYLKR
jgi:hypothetical protein